MLLSPVKFRYLAGLLVLLFMVSSCSSDQPEKTTDDGPLILTTRLRAEPDRLNPLLTVRGWSLHAAYQIFPTLLNYSPETLELSPMLAKGRPEVNPITDGPYKGGVAYTYEILDEAVWDNGQPVLASDYAFTLKTLFNPKISVGAPVYRSYLNMIRDVAIDPENPKKFTVMTDKPYIRSEYATGFFIYPEYAYDPDGLLKDFELSDLTDPEKAAQLAEDDKRLETFATAFMDDKNSRTPEGLVSCGPYKLEEWVPGERVVLAKKENWWGDKLAAQQSMLTAGPDKIIYRPISDATTALSLVKDQSLDVMNFIPNNKFVELQSNELVKEHYNLYTSESPVYNYYGINTNKPKLSDKRVRKALAHLLNVKEIIKTVKYDMATPIASPVPPSADYYNKDLQPIEFNVERARQLLSEAGWEDSNGDGTVDKVINGERQELSISVLITPRNEDSNNMALIFKQGAKQAGIEVVITPKEANVFREARNKGDFDLYAAGAAPDPGLYDFNQTWHSKSNYPNGSNFFGFGTAESDQLIEKIRVTLDKAERDVMYKRMQEIIYEEQPVIFIYNALDRVAINKRLKNFQPANMYPSVYENYFTK
ncbi:MAG: ABC transporter substrate-binding protein [Bacteroidota bacterium]